MTHDYKKSLDYIKKEWAMLQEFCQIGTQGTKAYEAIFAALELAIALQPKPISQAKNEPEWKPLLIQKPHGKSLVAYFCPERKTIAEIESGGVPSRRSDFTHFYDISALPKTEEVRDTDG